MEVPECFDIGTKTHKGDFMTEVYRGSERGPGFEDVVYWCGKCGAVIVDKERDGRYIRSLRELAFPEVLNQIK